MTRSGDMAVVARILERAMRRRYARELAALEDLGKTKVPQGALDRSWEKVQAAMRESLGGAA